jgi:hypothetical protein
MVKVQRILTVLLAVLALAMAGSVQAKAHQHKSGEQLIGAHVKPNGEHVVDKPNGEHVIDRHGKHTAMAEVVNGKIAGIKVKHSEKGDVPVKKVKSNKKMAQADETKVAQANALQPVAFMTVQAQDLGTIYIGYSYIDDNGDEVVYWFPYDMILDGDTGAVTYVPVA